MSMKPFFRGRPPLYSNKSHMMTVDTNSELQTPAKDESLERNLRIHVFAEAIMSYRAAHANIAAGKFIDSANKEISSILAWMNEPEPDVSEVVRDREGQVCCTYGSWPFRFETLCEELKLSPSRIRRWAANFKPTPNEVRARVNSWRAPKLSE